MLNNIENGLKESSFRKYVKSVRYSKNNKRELTKITVILHRHIAINAYEELEVVINQNGAIVIHNNSKNVKIANNELANRRTEVYLLIRSIVRNTTSNNRMNKLAM